MQDCITTLQRNAKRTVFGIESLPAGRSSREDRCPPDGRRFVARVLDPHDQPPRSKKSPASLFHAASKRVRDDFRSAYYAFVAAFREAAEKLKAGILPVVFPSGSFPPALPFVGG